MPDPIQKRFFTPEFPLVEALAKGFLGAQQAEPTPHSPWLDLSGDLLLLPSRGACRALRETFVRIAAESGWGLLSPTITTPALFLEEFRPENAATQIECLDAWDSVLERQSKESLQPLFPAIGDTLAKTSRTNAVKTITGLRRTLSGAGHTLRSAEAAFRHSDIGPSARWEVLARLESEFQAYLQHRGLTDPESIVPPGTHLPPAFREARRIHLCTDPEPSPKLISTLGNLRESGTAITLWIAADSTNAADFDPWGRPLPQSYSRRHSPLPAEAITTAASPQALADALRREEDLRKPTRQPEDFAIGIADPAMIPAIRTFLDRSGLKTFDPAGIKLVQTGGHAFFRRFLEWLSNGSIASLHEWLHLPLAAEWLESPLPQVKLLTAIDTLRRESVVVGIEAACKVAPATIQPTLANALEWWRRAQGGSSLLPDLRQHLLKTGRENPRSFNRLFRDARTAETFLDLLRELESLPPRRNTSLLRLRLALDPIGSLPSYPVSTADGVEILGWQEWIWSAHARLVVSGLAEGRVPESFRGDPFLNDSERRTLGLPTAESRFERDAFLFHLLAKLRTPGESLRVVHCATNTANDPVRPSRLLFQVPDADLPKRVGDLFGSIVHAEERPPPSPPREYVLTSGDVPEAVAVSTLSTWLDCPKRYFLKCIRKMDSLDAFGELSPRHFGTLVHTCLEKFNTSAVELTGFEPIRDALFAFLDAEVQTCFGPKPGTLPYLQVRAIRRRLEATARIIAESREEGWRPIRAEWRFGTENRFAIEDIPLRGTVDCIEHNPDTDHYRIIDYKTSAKPKPPAERLFGPFPGHLDRTVFGPEETVPIDGKRDMRWIDLQLPLYAIAVEQLLGFETTTAYFNIPHDPGETALVPFAEDSPEIRESAFACAAHVLRSIRAGVFEPARRRPSPMDEFSAIAVEDPDTEFRVVP